MAHSTPVNTMLWLNMCHGAGGRCITRQLPGSPLVQRPALRVSGPRPVWRTTGGHKPQSSGLSERLGLSPTSNNLPANSARSRLRSGKCSPASVSSKDSGCSASSDVQISAHKTPVTASNAMPLASALRSGGQGLRRPSRSWSWSTSTLRMTRTSWTGPRDPPVADLAIPGD